jgi:hypothetical protein
MSKRAARAKLDCSGGTCEEATEALRNEAFRPSPCEDQVVRPRPEQERRAGPAR